MKQDYKGILTCFVIIALVVANSVLLLETLNATEIDTSGCERKLKHEQGCRPKSIPGCTSLQPKSSCQETN